MDLFCICQQADTNRPYLYFSYSVAYPNGFPSEYSIIAAFEVVKGSPQLGWDLWQVSYSEIEDRVSIRVLTDRQSLGLSYTMPD